jgi:hypothetical protein
LYDLTTDPYELANLAATADPGLLSQLSDRVGALRDCAAESCRATEDLPVPQI